MSELAPPARRHRPIHAMLLCESLGVTGGVERFVCELANALVERGLRVTLGNVDTARGGVVYPLDPRVDVSSAGVALIEPRAGSRLGRALAMLKLRLRVGRSLNRLVDAAAPDVVVLNGLVTACSVLMVAKRGGLARRAICCDHNHFGARSALWQRLRARCYPRVAAVVSLTEADAPKFRALNVNTRVIANTSSLRADAPSNASSPRVLAVGRHVAQKGFDLLLHAWRDVIAAVPEARLCIVGEGPLHAELLALSAQLGVEASVEWRTPTDHIEALYREAAVFVLSSRYEGMPLALLEAQALGVPAVAFDCPTGPREIVTTDTGILVEAEDTAALARAIALLLRDPARRSRMSQAAIARSRLVFDPQRQMDALAGLIESVAARAGA